MLSVISGLSRKGHTVIIADHYLEWVAEFADRVVALEKGRIIAFGKPNEVMNLPEMLSAGIGWSRYTQAAEKHIQRTNLSSTKRTPINLDQAIDFFQNWYGNHED